MKKNLLTLIFVVAFLCSGALVVSAKNLSSPENSVAVSKRLSVAKTISNKIKALKAKCGANEPCASQLFDLIDANATYELSCNDDYTACSSQAEDHLIQTAAIYEMCLWYNGYLESKNIDKTKDRDKRQGPKV